MPTPSIHKYGDSWKYGDDIKYGTYKAQRATKITYKVYKPDGTFLGVLNDVISDLSFDKVINGGLSELVLTTKKKIDNYTPSGLLKLNNRIKIYVTDQFNDFKIMYEGYIVSQDPFLDERGEGVEITLLPNISKLQNDFYRSGTNLTITKNSTDPSQIMKDIIDNYKAAVNNSMISYDDKEVVHTGTTISYKYKQKKHLQAIRKTAEFLPVNWFWRIKANGNLIVEQTTTSAHTFMIKKHIKVLKMRKNIEKVINKYFFWNGRDSADPNYINTVTDDTDSQDLYDIIAKQRTDGRVTVAATATILSNSKINNQKDPKSKIFLKISANYDIANIEPGQTCNIRNIDHRKQTTFDNNLLITRVKYNPDFVELEIAENQPEINSGVNEIENNLDDQDIDTDDRLLTVPNVQLSTRTRAHTAIVDPAGTEEFTTIEAALTSVSALGGGTVLLKKGTITLTQNITIPDNIIIKGEDRGKSIINAGAYNFQISGTVPYNTGSVEVVNGRKQVIGNGTAWTSQGIEEGVDIFKLVSEDAQYIIDEVISDTELKLKTVYTGTSYVGIAYAVLLDQHDIGLFDFTFINGDNSKFQFDLITRLLIQRITIEGKNGDTVDDGIDINGGQDIEITDCIIQHNGGRGITIDDFRRNVFVLRNNCTKNDLDGIFINAHFTRCQYNECNDNLSDGIDITSDNNDILGNICNNNGVYGISLRAGADNNSVTNNQAAGNTTTDINDAGTGNNLDNNN